jgi:release factor glutamine methyltransferase
VELALEKLSQQISQKSVEDVESIFTQKQQFIIENQNLVADNTNSAIGNQRIAAARKNLTVLDLCTGSGCIGLSVKKYFPQAEVTLSDLSGDALDVARYNAGALGLDVRFVQGDLFENITNRFHMILSNPPYIASDEIEVLMPEVRDYEPRMALDGEADGLAFYRRIVREAGDYLYPGGWLMFEIGMDQGES